MQYKCDKCNDSGSLNKFGPYYDCTSCDAAEQRVALEKFRDELREKGEGFDDIAFAIHQRALAMAPKQDEAEELPDGWYITEKTTCYVLCDRNTVVASLSGPDSKENAAIIARMLTAPAVANGALTDEQINWHAKNIYGTAATAQEVEFAKSILAAAGPDAALADLLIEVSDVLAEQNWRGDLQERLRDVAALSGAKGN